MSWVKTISFIQPLDIESNHNSHPRFMRILLGNLHENNIFVYLGVKEISSRSFSRIFVRALDQVMSSKMGLIYCSCLFWQTWNAEISYAFNKVKKMSSSLVNSFSFFDAYAMQVIILCFQSYVLSGAVSFGNAQKMYKHCFKNIFTFLWKNGSSFF